MPRLFLLLLASACAAETSPPWVIAFEDDEMRARSRIVEAQIREGGCSGDVVHDVRFSVNGSPEAMPPRLDPGRFGFSARAVGEDCEVVGEGCVEVDLPVDRIVVSLERGASIRLCPVGTCQAGECNERALVRVAAGRAHTCASDYGGRLYCWGMNVTGQLGDGSTLTRPTPTRIAQDLSLRSLSAGGTGSTEGWNSHTCAVADDSRVLCWGYNADGQVGDGTREDRTLPTEIALAAQQISAGGQHTCAVQTNGGALHCWGDNTEGQLGVADPPQVLLPMLVSSPAPLVEVSSGELFTCIRHVSGRVHCSGANDNGQLGYGDFEARSRFAERVPLADLAVDISAGRRHACAVLQDGRVQCWGANDFGQLGVEAGPDVPQPSELPDLNDAVEVSAGAEFTCVRRANGTSLCFGRNGFGERGGGEAIGAVGNAVDLLDAVQLDAGSNQGCAIRVDGELWCWGQAQHGRLGNDVVELVLGGFAPLRVAFPE
ncbi:MAG: hypothetical protein AAF938_13385 [Myxococcota bacterium]